jgi:hypothetical protein
MQIRPVRRFKSTKTEKPRRVRLPESVLTPLVAHGREQNKLRQQFGPDYGADMDLIFAIHMAGHSGRIPGFSVSLGLVAVPPNGAVAPHSQLVMSTNPLPA